jgi:hypothetical protein
MKAKNKYIVKQNPKNKAWYVLADCLGYLMPISDQMKTREQALRWATRQLDVDRAAQIEVKGSLVTSCQLD